MLAIPAALQAQYTDFLKNRMVPSNEHSSYLKWLRFYLDFCCKYHFLPAWKESLVHFLRKPDEKRLTKVRQEQASQAIMLYDELVGPMGYRNDDPRPTQSIPPRILPMDHLLALSYQLVGPRLPNQPTPGTMPPEDHLP